MSGRLILLLEEPSMQELLDHLLPRLFPGWQSGVNFLCVRHEGKSDLDRSIPRKLAAWRIAGDRFIVVRDSDGADCLSLKSRLCDLCKRSGRSDTLVRLVCQELESWYLGDLKALATAFGTPSLDSAAYRKRFAQPDGWQKPSVEVKRLIPTFQKTSGARAMGQHLGLEGNRSRSFQVLIEGLRRLEAELR